jgi:hypothetical protein
MRLPASLPIATRHVEPDKSGAGVLPGMAGINLGANSRLTSVRQSAVWRAAPDDDEHYVYAIAL